MIYAKDAHKISEENNHEREIINHSVEKALALFEKTINESAKNGCFGCFIKKNVIKDIVNDIFIKTDDVMDAIADELKTYGYNVSIPQSYTSIHVDW